MVGGSLAKRRGPSLCRETIALIAVVGVALLTSPARAEPDGSRASGKDAPATDLDFLFSAPRFSVGLRGGWAFNRSEGEIYDFLTQTLTLQKANFDSYAIAVDFSWQLLSWLDIVFGLEVTSASELSEFRDFVDDFGAPIIQETRLIQVPVGLSVRLYPLERGRQVGHYAFIPAKVVPYVGCGFGVTWYELRQEGAFVDFTDLEIFEDILISEGWAFAGHAFVGVDLQLTRRFGLVVEGRYYWAEADLAGSFVGFDRIDLSGARVMVGFNWKF